MSVTQEQIAARKYDEGGWFDAERYRRFIGRKAIAANPCGVAIADADIHPLLFDFQRAIVRWAIGRGRAAVFADCGLGKTLIQLEWMRIALAQYGTDAAGIVITPLAVSHQTQREAAKIGIEATIVETAADLRPGINITNYEKLHHFTPDAFAALVLDESSILKSFGGVYRQALTDFASTIDWRLCCTATPAPNDLLEIANHAEFLNVLSGKEIIALFFKTDGNTTHSWRLKHHAEQDFWKWMASWSIAMRKPSDIGFDDAKFILPPLRMEQHIIAEIDHGGNMFCLEAQGLQDRRDARRRSLPERVMRAAALVNESSEQWLVWCDLNAESDALKRSIPGAVEVRGSDTNQHKEKSLLGFSDGSIRVLITKPSIAGHGMNWQNCANMIFTGLSDSYEQFYQAVRRCWRFGQAREVNAHIIIGEAEGAVLKNIEAKEKKADGMFANILVHMKGLQMGQSIKQEMEYVEDVAEGKGWTLYRGDSVLMIDRIESESVGLAVFSPPFPGMYAYTDSRHDMGNVKSLEEMIEQFRFLVAPQKLMRVMMPGRNVCVHLLQLTAMKSREGYIGLKDYRGKVIQMMEEEGWIYAGEVLIDKNPQIQATRNKERGLLFKSLATDSSVMRMGLADYIIQFRKPGENIQPIRAGTSARYNTEGWITEKEWIEWAAPVWYRQTKDYPGGIRETDVLNTACAKDGKDERHICPLQLGVIERCVKLWSAPGELVLSPFAGIGSEGYVALKLNRQFVGIELKESYWKIAQKNLSHAASHCEVDMFGTLEA